MIISPKLILETHGRHRHTAKHESSQLHAVCLWFYLTQRRVASLLNAAYDVFKNTTSCANMILCICPIVFILYTARYKTNLVCNVCTGPTVIISYSSNHMRTNYSGSASSMIVNLGSEVVGSAEDTMKGKVDALYAMFDDLIHGVNEVAMGESPVCFCNRLRNSIKFKLLAKNWSEYIKLSRVK